MKRAIFLTMLLGFALGVFPSLGAQVNITLGDGTATNTTTGSPAPYGTWYKNFREQYLVLASELNDAGGGVGNINSIAFNVQSLNNCSPMPNYRIRIKTTTQTALNSTFETGDYQQVFQANEFMPVAGWNTHAFSTPFNWNGTANLLIDIVTDIVPGNYAQNASVPYTTTGFNSSLRYQNDSNPAINATNGSASMNRSNMQFNMEALDITDLNAISIVGPSTPNVNSIVNYTVSVKNYSLTTQTNYTVKLMRTGGIEIASVAGTPILPHQTIAFTLPWIPAVVGEAELYGRVVLVGDENPANDETDRLTVVVMEEGLLVTEIGTGTATNTNTGAPAPYGTYYKAFRQQLLYTADDFYAAGAIPGMISALAFNVQSLSTCSPMPNYTIRLKQTDQTVLSTTFELGDYTTVWQGASFMPVTGWNIHGFGEPFLWDGTSNLLVDITTDMVTNYTYNALVYYSNTGYASSLRFQSDSANGSTGTTGITSNNRSNIRFFMAPSTGDPVFMVNPASHDFGDVNLGGSRSQNFTIINAGGGTLDINQISIGGSSTMVLSSLPTLPVSLATGETAVFTVTYTPLSQNEDIATVTITDNLNTHTVQLTGSGVTDITIGDGNQTAHVPLDFYYRSSLFETIYTVEEMNGFVGMITGIKLYNQFSSNLPTMPVKIWLGSTAQADLSAGWIPSTELTQVFDSTVDFPSGQNVISISFPEYYMHLDGGNLIMMVQRPLDTSYYSSNDNFKVQTIGSNRSLKLQSDSIEYDPANPTGGTLNGVFPKTTFTVIPGGVGHISGTVYAGTSPLEGVLVKLNGGMQSVYTGSDGSFLFINLLPNTYSLSFSKHAYISQELQIELEEDETEIVQIDLQPMLRVDLSGNIIASDSMQGIEQATIRLMGYEDYQGQSLADGSFVIPQMVAEQSYTYSITHPAYTSIYGQLELGEVDYALGTIIMNEMAYAPHSLVAEELADHSAVALVWQEPVTEAVGLFQSFEEPEFPPQDWTQIITNTAGPFANGTMATWARYGQINSGSTVVTPVDGGFQAGLWWAYDHQDEWLISSSFLCPSDALLSFESYVFLGSTDGDNYNVKVFSETTGVWQTLWNASTLNGGWHPYSAPVVIDLSFYHGQQIKLAFHAEDPPTNDGLRYQWFIDNIEVATALRQSSRSLQGYSLWRLNPGSEGDVSAWTAITENPVNGLAYSDPAWNTLPAGDYKWAVKAEYSNEVFSSASFSGVISKLGGSPFTVQNLSIEVQGDNVVLTWDAVQEDIGGNPISGVYYEVHLLETPDLVPSPYTVFEITEDTTFTIEDILLYLDSSFFCVKAVIP
ncbi:MAG: carboxypeptidase regulatory-like domain-containing protein [Candidatus Cloacimonetes bacterium]|nr:carboxypeptidase regulatory-like domain-containing protein [Candidatus Cloacimonadota bacterium]